MRDGAGVSRVAPPTVGLQLTKLRPEIWTLTTAGGRAWRCAAPLQLCGRSAGCRGAAAARWPGAARRRPGTEPRTTALAPPRARHCTALPSTRGGEIGSKIETRILQSRFFYAISTNIWYKISSCWFLNLMFCVVLWSVYPQDECEWHLLHDVLEEVLKHGNSI